MKRLYVSKLIEYCHRNVYSFMTAVVLMGWSENVYETQGNIHGHQCLEVTGYILLSTKCYNVVRTLTIQSILFIYLLSNAPLYRYSTKRLIKKMYFYHD